MFKKSKSKVYSNHLQRDVKIVVFKSEYFSKMEEIQLLLLNDGQDVVQLNLENTLNHHFEESHQLLIIGIEANDQRLFEYGTSSMADYKKRGNKAAQHEAFLLTELLPFVYKKYIGKRKITQTGIVGFSLGGLSAFDIGWTNPTIFQKIGVFSGSFWWRSKAYKEGFVEDNDRIMHQIVKKSEYKEGLKFWFEAGTNDETSDRNNNGIIDAIDDTQDLIKELNTLGYKNKQDIDYVEVQGGEHNFNTWQQVFPVFLEWFLKK